MRQFSQWAHDLKPLHPLALVEGANHHEQLIGGGLDAGGQLGDVVAEALGLVAAVHDRRTVFLDGHGSVDGRRGGRRRRDVVGSGLGQGCGCAHGSIVTPCFFNGLRASVRLVRGWIGRFRSSRPKRAVSGQMCRSERGLKLRAGPRPTGPQKVVKQNLRERARRSTCSAHRLRTPPCAAAPRLSVRANRVDVPPMSAARRQSRITVSMSEDAERMHARAPGPERLQAAIDLVVARLQPENIQTCSDPPTSRVDVGIERLRSARPREAGSARPPGARIERC